MLLIGPDLQRINNVRSGRPCLSMLRINQELLLAVPPLTYNIIGQIRLYISPWLLRVKCLVILINVMVHAVLNTCYLVASIVNGDIQSDMT